MKKEGLISVVSAVLFSIFLSIFSSCSQDTLNLYSIIPDEETQALCDMFTEQTGIPVGKGAVAKFFRTKFYTAFTQCGKK